MEGHSPNIVADIEDNEEVVDQVEDQVTEPEPVPEKSILKSKPKRPRSQAQQVAFARCQAARRLKLASKPETDSKVKNMPVEKTVEKTVEKPVKKPRKKRQPTVIDLNQLSDSEEDESNEIIYKNKR